MIDYQEAHRLIGHLPPSHHARKASTELHRLYAAHQLPAPPTREHQRASLHRGVILCLIPGLAAGMLVVES